MNSEESRKAWNEIQNDTEAFRQLVLCHEAMLARFVLYRIGNSSDAEDVLQETLVAIWLGFRRVQNPARMQAWLLHVAQNRCRDYFRAQGRKELPLEEETLQIHASRFGLHQYRHREAFSDAVDALEAAPPAAGEAARRFYLEGRSIAEIAALSQSPPGTVKRRLFQARRAARTFLGVSSPASQSHKEKPMPTQTTDQITISQTDAGHLPAFPLVRPQITITELNESAFSVDCQELRCWPIIPRVGEQGASADYVLTEGDLTFKLEEVKTLQALRTAAIHGVVSVEIEVHSWKPDAGWQRPGTIHGRLTEDNAEFLAVHLPEFPDNISTQIETFLDSTFAWNWGVVKRKIADLGLLHRASDGSILVSETLLPQPGAESGPEMGAGVGFGMVRLEVGGKVFTCLRVFDLPDGDLATTDDYLTESYLTREGRTVLVRRFCRPESAEIAQFPKVLDDSERVTLNGTDFVHWYDTLTELTLQESS
jgi:RNA polymerase sigma-70 factor (ECF subfamily)